MGYGIGVKCRCQEKELILGMGRKFLSIYEETMNNIRVGKYGVEMRDLVKNEEYIAVDIEYYAYFCKSCGWVGSLIALDLYKPKDTKKIEQIIEKYGLLCSLSDNEDYVLLKEYKHMCPKCRKVMKKTKTDELFKKICATCGEKYQDSGLIMYWD